MMPRLGSVLAVLGVAGAFTVASPADARADLEQVLKQRYATSRLEVQNVALAGTVTDPRTVLRLEADGVPAKRFRVSQVNTKSPRFHVRDYARVEITGARVIGAEGGELTLARGTRLVVLDLRTEADRIRLFTHTAEPVSAGPRRAAYGCTEFVFRLEPALLQGRDPTPVQQVIERWVRVEAGGRATKSVPAQLVDLRP